MLLSGLLSRRRVSVGSWVRRSSAACVSADSMSSVGAPVAAATVSHSPRSVEWLPSPKPSRRSHLRARAVMRCALAAICSSVSVSLTTLKRWLPAVQILPSLCIRARERATAGTGRLLPYFDTKISEDSDVLRRMMASTSSP